MLKALLIFSLLFSVIAKVQSDSGTPETEISPEFVMRQEITLNQLITNLHLLQLDFQNRKAREKLQESLTLLDNSLTSLSVSQSDKETEALISNTKALWPVVRKHADWIANLSEEKKVPETHSLQLALVKLDRQLLLLQQKLTNQKPLANNPALAFLEQALLMQRLSREYLHLTLNSKQKDIIASGQVQLETLIHHFDQKLERLDLQLKQYPQGSASLRKVKASWRYIKAGMLNFPRQSAPELIARHSNRVVSRLTSVYQLF